MNYPQVMRLVTKALGRPPQRAESLLDAGLDSLQALGLRSALELRLGVSLPETLLLTCPSVAAIAAFVHGTMGESEDAAALK